MFFAHSGHPQAIQLFRRNPLVSLGILSTGVLSKPIIKCFILCSRLKWKVKVLVTQSCLTLCDHMDCSLLCPWNSPGKNAQVGRPFLLQGTFRTLGSNLGLLHCRQILYHLATREAPFSRPESRIILWFYHGLKFAHPQSANQLSWNQSCKLDDRLQFGHKWGFLFHPKSVRYHFKLAFHIENWCYFL